MSSSRSFNIVNFSHNAIPSLCSLVCCALGTRTTTRTSCDSWPETLRVPTPHCARNRSWWSAAHRATLWREPSASIPMWEMPIEACPRLKFWALLLVRTPHVCFVINCLQAFINSNNRNLVREVEWYFRGVVGRGVVKILALTKTTVLLFFREHNNAFLMFLTSIVRVLCFRSSCDCVRVYCCCCLEPLRCTCVQRT